MSNGTPVQNGPRIESCGRSGGGMLVVAASNMAGRIAVCNACGVSDTERVVNELIAALHEAAERLNDRAIQLNRSDGWSSATSTLEIVHWATDGHAAISGYVEGERSEVGAVAWVLDLIREGDAWRVERSQALNRNDSSEQETVAELPVVRFDSTRRLATELASLVHELTALPAPE